MTVKHKKLIISSNLNNVGKVEAFIDKLFGRLNVELYNKIQLAVNEAVTNAILHGNKEDNLKKVEIAVREKDEEVEITVKDEGKGFDAAAIPDPTDKKRLLKTSGRGVFLIKHMADEVSFKKKGTIVKMVFKS